MQKQIFEALPYGTMVHFGPSIEGEIIAVKFHGPKAQTLYAVEWWSNEGEQVVSEIYEDQIRFVRN